MILDSLAAATTTAVEEALSVHNAELTAVEVGTVISVQGSIAHVEGLPHIGYEELLRFPDGLLGIAIDLNEHDVGVVLLGDSSGLNAGVEVSATGRQVDTPVGAELLGRVIDATGNPLDGAANFASAQHLHVEREAPAIMDRAPVTVPLQTGIKSVDALIPIGRGQRELIVGDRQTGKTSLAVSSILNQKDTKVICIYCAIGQRSSAVAQVIDTLEQSSAMQYTVVVVASGEDSPGLQYITPFAATTIAEHFMASGNDVLLVFDDLTRHARAYRELSLLLRRPPGREAYPGDIFYIHSRLLERSTHLKKELGGGSLTTLPIVETQAQDLSSYIPTNLISITDGQIFLSTDLYRRGFLPAIDVGKSVSRVGGKTQLPVYRRVAGDLGLSFSQFEELETFARFSTRLDPETLATIERGRKVRQILNQGEHLTLTVSQQIAALYAVTSGLLDEVSVDEVTQVETAIYQRIQELAEPVCEKLDTGKNLDKEDWLSLSRAIGTVVQNFQSRLIQEN